MTPRPRSYDSARPGGRTPMRPGGRPRPGDGRLSPRARPKKRKDPMWTKLVIIFGALVMVGSGLTVAGPKLLAAWFLGDVTQIEPPIPEEMQGKSLDGDINFLLIGLDRSLGSSYDEAGEVVKNPNRKTLADSIILVHIPAAHDQVYMISIPRDLRVNIPALPEVSLNATWATKINNAFATGATATSGPSDHWQRDPDVSKAGMERGVAQTMKVISSLVPLTAQDPADAVGLQFHGAAVIDFSGFDKLIEAVGSVEMCVNEDELLGNDPEGLWSIHYLADGTKAPREMAQRFYDYHTAPGYGYGGAAEVASRSQRYFYPLGCHEMKPWEALDLSRQRVQYKQSDYSRHLTQQRLLRSIVGKLASPDTFTNLGTIQRLQEAVGPLLTLGLGGHAIQDWVLTLRHLRAESIVSIKFNGGDFCNYGDNTGDQCMLDASTELLRAVHDDTLFGFLEEHKDWIG